MPDRQQLFAAFPPASKKDWAQQVTKDLKGKSLAELNWQLEEHIRLAPLQTAEDLARIPSPLTSGRPYNTWQIGEYIEVADLGAANAQALEGLAGGCNAPLFRLHHLPSMEELKILLADIQPHFISAHFAPLYPGRDPAELFRNLIYYVRYRGIDLADISGSMDFDPLLDWTDPPFRALARILRFADRYMPNFKVLQVNGHLLHTGIENTSRELALILAKGTEYLAQLELLGIPPALTNRHLQFTVATSTSYFVEIAKIRALKILWANVLNGYHLPAAPIPPVAAHLAPESQTPQTEYNMIMAATQALAAAVGGADLVYVLPANFASNEPSTSFTRRIARNVQHLLQLESGLDRVVDPAAGSYFIENLTQQLCAQAWQRFQEIEKSGGYLNLA